MDVLIYLLPVALVLGLLGLGGFFWALKSGQFDDPVGAATRILRDDETDLRMKSPTAEDDQGR